MGQKRLRERIILRFDEFKEIKREKNWLGGSEFKMAKIGQKGGNNFFQRNPLL